MMTPLLLCVSFFHRLLVLAVVPSQDGKPAGWHDYEAAASDIVEDVYQNWQDDKTLNVRCVQVGVRLFLVPSSELIVMIPVLPEWSLDVPR